MDCCILNVTAACASKDAEIAELKQQLSAQEPEDVQVAKAQRDDALRLLGRIVKRLDKAGGFSWPEEQGDMRAAKALLADTEAAKRRRY